jgi:hypothetical protein
MGPPRIAFKIADEIFKSAQNNMQEVHIPLARNNKERMKALFGREKRTRYCFTAVRGSGLRIWVNYLGQ